MPEPVLTPDICVIGGGSAGLSLAAGAAAFGVETILVERGRMGGECLNTGCVPLKALLTAARRASLVRDGARFGIGPGRADVDFSGVMAFVHGAIRRIAPQDSIERFEQLGVRVITGEAVFDDARTLLVGSQRIRARRFVIATGSAPRIPDVPGLAAAGYLTNETVFALTRLPPHLAILGGGASGVEFARAFARLGSRVTLIEQGEMLAEEDREAVALIRASLVADGVELMERTSLLGIEGREGAISLHVRGPAGETVTTASHLLLAAGRVARTEGLGLERAGVRVGARGIETDHRLRSSNPRIHAIGDVLGDRQFTHAANAEAGLVLRSILFRLPVDIRALPIPRVLHGEPDLVQVGLTEAEARARGGAVHIERMPLSGNDAAVTAGIGDGFIKVMTGRRGRVLGVTLVGEGTAELSSFWVLALQRRLRLPGLAGLVLPYPSLGETGRQLALRQMAPLAGKRLVRLLVWLLARLG